MSVHIASVAVAVPDNVISQPQVEAFLGKHFAARLSQRNLAVMRKVFSHPSVKSRHFAGDDLECLVNEDADGRIGRFAKWAVDLSERAASGALKQAGLMANKVSDVVVNTCTGYLCPGLSTYLIERLGLSRETRAYDLVGGGCGGAVANLQLSGAILRGNREGIVLSVSVEICSATFQMGDDPGLIISNAIFGDGAAAAVLWNMPQGLELTASASRYAPEHRDHIRYVHKGGQLHNQLSPCVPELAGRAAAESVTDLLGSTGLQIADVRHWALHPGGDKVIGAIKRGIGLSEEQVSPARSILAEYGNMSSPTVWFVLRKILDTGMAAGDWCTMLSFGAGFSTHACLLRLRCHSRENGNPGSYYKPWIPAKTMRE